MVDTPAERRDAISERHIGGLSTVDCGLLRLHRYAACVAASTFLLLIAGGLVTSTDSGLAVPDWPLSYGTLFPPMVGGIVFEHTHRLIAGAVGVLIAALAVWLHRRESRRWVRRLGDAAVIAVIVQAILGGVTVLLVLPAPISIAHACLGQLVFCLVVSVALVTSPWWSRLTPIPPSASNPTLAWTSMSLLVLIFAQLLLGAALRHAGSALLAHVIGAVVVLVTAIRLAWWLKRSGSDTQVEWRMSLMLVLGLLMQVVFGLLSLAHRDRALITTTHQALGAWLLAHACVLAWVIGRRQGRVGIRAASRPVPST